MQHELQTAISRLRMQLSQTPGNLDATSDLAALLAQSGQNEQAMAVLMPAVASHPEHLPLSHNLAELLRQSGQLEQAQQLFTQLLERDPLFLPAYPSLCSMLEDRLAQTGPSDAQAEQLRHTLAVFRNNQGNALVHTGDFQNAAQAYQQSIAHAPQYANAHSNLSNVLRMQGYAGTAELHARQAIALNPQLEGAWNNLGTALSQQSRFAEATEAYQHALTLDPTQAAAQHNATSGSLFLAQYREDLSAAQLLELHRQWGQSVACAAPRTVGVRPAVMHIGFISPDFVEHSVMYFAEGLLQHLDRTRFTVFCYANQHQGDSVTQRIAEMPLRLRWVSGLSDEALCAQIQADGVHVLIDLSGHSKGNRLRAMAQRPAPIQALWMGYSFSSGLPAIDYRITDAFTDPPALASQENTEQVRYLAPSQFNYRPRHGVPAVAPLPALTAGHITFGCLNNSQKINRLVVQAWSQVLHSVPNSRLLVHHKFLVDPGSAGRLRGMFEAFGIDPRRLDVRPFSVEHLSTYHEIDIALDCFPYNGATTTCEALWMGVPVVALRGHNPVGRMGASILNAAQLGDWLAEDVDGFVGIAQRASQDLGALSALRQGMRARLQSSPLLDSVAFAKHFGACLDGMWEDKAKASS